MFIDGGGGIPIDGAMPIGEIPTVVPLAEGRGGTIMFIYSGGGMLIGGIPTGVGLAGWK